MLKRVAIGLCLACLLGGTAYAADDQPPPGDDQGEDQCDQLLASTEEAVRDKVEADKISDADTDKLNELLDQADAQCTDGNMAGANQTLAQVKSALAKVK